MGLELLIFLASPIINAWWDSIHGEIHHFRSWLIRGGGIIVVSVAMAFLFPNPWPQITNSIWWVYLMIGIFTEFMWFDYLYNWFSGNKWDYIGEEEWHKDDWTWKIYKKMQKVPIMMLVLKAWLWITSITLYYQLDLL